MESYGRHLKFIQKYIEVSKNSPEHIRKTIFIVSVGAVMLVVLTGWLLTLNIFSSLENQDKKKFEEEQTKKFGSDVHSILDAFQKRLNEDKGKYSTPPAYFIDRGEIPTTDDK